jgi:beta-glucosidase
MTSTPPGRSARTLLEQLTSREKASLLDGSDFWHTQPIDRLGIPSIMVTDGPHGLRKQAGASDHLGLNASVPATCFPAAASIASSWNTALLHRIGEALGDESRAQDVAVLLGPGVNMKRSPLCGRNFEYYSEDPYLAGVLATDLILGLQSKGVGASVKHFAANNQETERMTIDVDVDERTLREIYFPAFERVVVEAQPWTVMCSYNRVNGRYVSEDRRLLTGVLREEWGFAGAVISDWGAVNERDRAVAAGMDLEMPSSGGNGQQKVLDALSTGTLSEADVDEAVLHVLELVEKAAEREPLERFDADAHHDLARLAALESAVLLKNDDDILPLALAGGRIAVIGEFARTPRFQGAGSSQVNPTRVDTALDGLEALLDGGRELVFSPGYEIEVDQAQPALIEEAVAAAAGAEVAVVFLGLPPSHESEGYDRDHMDLPEGQRELLHRIADVNSSVVVVLSNGAAVILADWEHRAKAVLEGWLLGQAGGRATAELLLGLASPSAKLAETIPMRFEDNPSFGSFPGEFGTVRYGEGVLIGYRWYDARRMEVSYPFGHGLSYTRFDYSDLEAEVIDDGPAPRVVVHLTVTNTGDRAGAEIVQLYVRDLEASVARPQQELKGFAKVALEPAEDTRVRLELDGRAFAFWDIERAGWNVEGGDFELRVGASSRDIRLTARVHLTGESRRPALSIDSTTDDFLARDDSRAWLLQKLEGASMGDALLDEAHGRMLRAIPLVRLSRFPDTGFDEADLRDALDALGA